MKGFCAGFGSRAGLALFVWEGGEVVLFGSLARIEFLRSCAYLPKNLKLSNRAKGVVLS